MAERTYIVRQHLRHAAGGLFVDVWKTSSENGARATYDSYVKDFPDQYFELVHVVVTETCLAHTGKPNQRS